MTSLHVYIGFESDTQLTEKPESCDFKYINYNQNIAYRKLSDKILGLIFREFLYPLFPEDKKVEVWGLWHKPDKVRLPPEHQTPQRQIKMQQNLVTPPNTVFNILEIPSRIQSVIQLDAH